MNKRLARTAATLALAVSGIAITQTVTAAPASAAGCITVKVATTASSQIGAGGRRIYLSRELTVPNSPCKDINVHTTGGTATVQIWAAGGSISGGWTPVGTSWKVVLGGANNDSLRGLRYRIATLDRSYNLYDMS